MTNVRLFAPILIFCLLFAGCGAGRPSSEVFDPANGQADHRETAEALLRDDPAGPLPTPQLPPELATAAEAEQPEPPSDVPLPYTVVCSSPDAPELAETFSKSNLLQLLVDSPTGRIGLEQRLASSLEEGKTILRSYGYYEGTVTGRIELAPASGSSREAQPENRKKAEGKQEPGKARDKAVVHVSFAPGPRYLIGRTTITPAEGAAMKGEGLPATLADVGLPQDSPAVADDILNTVDKARDAFREHGYPFAKIDATRYVLDYEKRRLEAEVRVNAGEFARMGDIRPLGRPSVTRRYLEAQRTWKPGEPWNQKKIEEFRDRLRQSGLFRSVDLDPAEEPDPDGRRDILAILAPAPERTVSGVLKYDSDVGPGVQGGWEHRNLTGRGDSLRVSMPLWLDMQELTAKYRLPFFLRDDQAFIAQAGLLNEDTDAYELRSAALSAGVERRFTPHWSGSLQGSAEGGSIKDPHEPRRSYQMFGLPVGLAYDSTGSLLDATNGMRALASLAPYAGTYWDDFNALRARMDVQGFLPLAGVDTLVLALRGTYGSLWGADAPNAPPSIRFYSGGGGSVRGYDYQSLGPRDSDHNPLGGSSLLELSGEARWKITPEWGIAAFLDGGMAYADRISNFGNDLRWGAGLGLRYYTAIGPLRFDVAAPLTPRSDDAPLQFYISIGQSF